MQLEIVLLLIWVIGAIGIWIFGYLVCAPDKFLVGIIWPIIFGVIFVCIPILLLWKLSDIYTNMIQLRKERLKEKQ